MKINNPSFKGTFCIDNKFLSDKALNNLSSKKESYSFSILVGGYRNPYDTFIQTSNENDNRVMDLLSRLKIDYRQVDEEKALSEPEIVSRMVLSGDAEMGRCSLYNVDVKKLDSELKKNSELYVGQNGINGFGNRYDRFKNFLKTNQPIESPYVYFLRLPDGSVSTRIYDGRHRFAVLRDMGLSSIFVAMNEKSKTLAQEIGLL